MNGCGRGLFSSNILIHLAWSHKTIIVVGVVVGA